jgi:hypothetical protein
LKVLLSQVEQLNFTSHFFTKIKFSIAQRHEIEVVKQYNSFGGIRYVESKKIVVVDCCGIGGFVIGFSSFCG